MKGNIAVAVGLFLIGGIVSFFGIILIPGVPLGGRGGGLSLNELMVYAGLGLMVIGAALFVIRYVRRKTR